MDRVKLMGTKCSPRLRGMLRSQPRSLVSHHSPVVRLACAKNAQTSPPCVNRVHFSEITTTLSKYSTSSIHFQLTLGNACLAGIPDAIRAVPLDVNFQPFSANFEFIHTLALQF